MGAPKSRDFAWKLPAMMDALSALRQHRSHQGFMAAAVSPHPTPTQRLLQQQDNASLNIFQHLHSSSQPSKATEPPVPPEEVSLPLEWDISEVSPKANHSGSP